MRQTDKKEEKVVEEENPRVIAAREKAKERVDSRRKRKEAEELERKAAEAEREAAQFEKDARAAEARERARLRSRDGTPKRKKRRPIQDDISIMSCENWAILFSFSL